MATFKELFHQYFVEGIVNSVHKHFGGEQCYQEIPFLYHLAVCTFFILLFAYLTYRWRNHTADQNKIVKPLAPNLLEKICAVLGCLSLIYTIYRKIVRKEGLFLLNPCHVTLILQLILMVGDNSCLWMRRLHTVWTGWLFGPFGALIIPHLQGLSLVEIIVFFGQHLLILPFGPMLLARRYEYLRPDFKNHAIAFGSIIIYHFIILVPVCRIFKVNINFMLCHSPAEPLFPAFGYHYFFLEVFNLKWIGYVIRLISYLYVGWLTPARK